MALVNFLIFFLTAAGLSLQAFSDDYLGPSATVNLSTVWTCTIQPSDVLIANPLLLRAVPDSNLSFAAGFYYLPQDNAYLFGVYIVPPSTEFQVWTSWRPDPVIIVWSANHLVLQNSTLNFTTDGNLILLRADGSLVWSTNTSGQSVAGMNITESGNLVLFNHKNLPVWQSFDHPTNSLLPGQRLVQGMSLTPNTLPVWQSFDHPTVYLLPGQRLVQGMSLAPKTSTINSTASDLFYLTVHSDGLYAFAGANQPQLYYQYEVSIGNRSRNYPTYLYLGNGSLGIFSAWSSSADPEQLVPLPPALSLQFIKFGSDGHLRLYQWKADKGDWEFVLDVLPLTYCDYPTACGVYGICSNGLCSCPTASNIQYFRQIDDRRPHLGCNLEIPISCKSVKDHQLMFFPNVSYFYHNNSRASELIDEESCKQVCLSTCSCEAALFRYYDHNSSGVCTLVSQVLSLKIDHLGYDLMYLKVQVTPSPHPAKHRVLLALTVAGVFSLLAMLIIALVIVQIRQRRDKDEEDEFAELPGMPTRLSFEMLKVATKNFSNKLGEGGFGSVFSGQLGEERVAVKCLDQAGQGKKELFAEVKTIGSIHHINLVKLIGFCVEKSHRLLVYEFMSKGSLDQWIYYKDSNAPLDWHTRRRIITDIARGLTYLHEECAHKIAHLDIKPQNILLDDNFNARISDFGLSKLIGRDQSHVMTRMRGTPGYLAPEWLTSQITEKVDVYSFGVVVMEIIIGRPNLDYSKPEGSVQLITLLLEKAKNGQLEDMLDRKCNDMSLHQQEVIEIMKLAMWCLQSDSNRRPSMSSVMKVMEGERDVEVNLNYDFFDLSPAISVPVGQFNSSSPPEA